jgi:hypothetical protein
VDGGCGGGARDNPAGRCDEALRPTAVRVLVLLFISICMFFHFSSDRAMCWFGGGCPPLLLFWSFMAVIDIGPRYRRPSSQEKS